MSKISGYQCSVCGSNYTLDEVTYTCPKDGGVLDVVLNVEVIQKNTRPGNILNAAETSMWRYLPLLPVEDPGHFGTPLRSVGWTPVYRPPRIAKQLDMKAVWLKDESGNPVRPSKTVPAPYWWRAPLRSRQR